MRIKSAVLGLLGGFLVAFAAAAVEIPLKNGKMLDASSYKITGSYLMVTLANGQRIAYDIADVDLEALRRAETAAATPPEAAPPEARLPSIMDARAADDRPQSVVTISDKDVARAPSDDASEGADQGAAASGPPSGFTEGGGLVVDSLRVEKVDEGIWDVRGVVANRSTAPARDVRVQITITNAAGEVLASPTLELTPELAVGETVSFSHHVETPEQPAVKIRTYWLQSTPVAAQPAARGEGTAPGAAAAPSGPPPTPRPSPIY